MYYICLFIHIYIYIYLCPCVYLDGITGCFDKAGFDDLDSIASYVANKKIWRKCFVISVDYHQTYNINRTLVGNKIVDHSDVVGATYIGAAQTAFLILDLTPAFNGLGKDNCKMRRETFTFWYLVRLISEVVWTRFIFNEIDGNDELFITYCQTSIISRTKS